MLIIGVDDAGRGPIIGPMILAGVMLDKKGEETLRKHKIRDSKTVSPPERLKMAKMIREVAIAYKIVKADPEEIDTALRKGTNLNHLEAIKTAEIINELNHKKSEISVVVDCPSNNPRKWSSYLLKLIDSPKNLKLSCEHKADANHISVAAASILAKVTRDEEVAKIQEKYKHYGPLGSGYPADPTTKEFLKKNGEALRTSGIFRKSWATWKKLFPDTGQTKLNF